MGPQPDAKVEKRPPAVIDMSPAVSPDGKTVAFARGGQIWLVQSDGANERLLTSFAAPEEDAQRVVSNPCWSPAGDALIFVSFGDGSGQLTLSVWLASPQPGSERSIYSEKVDTEYGVYYAECTNPPVFEAGGARVLFTSISTGQPRVMSVAVDGTDAREVAAAPSAFPALDPAGQRLAYVDLSDSLKPSASST